MNVKETLFFPGWWKFVISGAITGIALAYLTGCVTPVEAEPEYPQYDRWWRADDIIEGNSMESGTESKRIFPGPEKVITPAYMSGPEQVPVITPEYVPRSVRPKSPGCVVDPMPLVEAPGLEVDFPGPFPMPICRPREWDQKWGLDPDEIRIGPSVSIGYETMGPSSFPLGEHVDQFGVRTYTQLL